MFDFWSIKMKVTGNCIIWLSHPIIKMFEHNQTHIETHCTPYFINILKSQTCQISYLFSQLVSVNTIFLNLKSNILASAWEHLFLMFPFFYNLCPSVQFSSVPSFLFWIITYLKLKKVRLQSALSMKIKRGGFTVRIESRKSNQNRKSSSSSF